MSDKDIETVSPDASPGSPGSPAASGKDKLIKTLFAVVAVAIFGWLIAKQYMTPAIDGWGNDLSAALTQAAESDRAVVALIFDSAQNFDYQKLVTVIKKKGNVEAVQDGNFICVQQKLGRDDPLAKKYKVTTFPTTLLINPDGSLKSRWLGYIGEVDFRSRFLKGDQQHK